MSTAIDPVLRKTINSLNLRSSLILIGLLTEHCLEINKEQRTKNKVTINSVIPIGNIKET